MKRWMVFIMCFSIFTIIIGGCEQQEKATETDVSVSEKGMKEIEYVSKVSSEEEGINQNEAVKIAQKKLTKDEKESVTNFETPNVEQINFAEEPSIYKYDKEKNMVGKQVYKITFYTDQDELLGPIVLYLDALDGQIYGEDYRE